MDHCRQSPGQPQSEPWNSLSPTWSPTADTEGTVVGLRNRGETPKFPSKCVFVNIFGESGFVPQEPVWILGWMGPHHGERELFRAAPHSPPVSSRPVSTESPCPPPSRGPQRCCVIPRVIIISLHFVLASMVDVTDVGLHISHWKLWFYIHNNLKHRAESDSIFFIDFIPTEHFYFSAELCIPCLLCAPKQSAQTQPAGNRLTCSSPPSVFHILNPISQLETQRACSDTVFSTVTLRC